MRDPWLLRPVDNSKQVRLFCFSHAGGNALRYLPWQSELGPAVDVCPIQLPGRGTRVAEAPPTSLPLLIAELAQLLCRYDQLPFVLFGHSLGALVAFELSRYCAAHGTRQPLHLVVSGCDAPRYRKVSRRLHELADEALMDVLAQYDGTPPEILAHREFMALLLPVIRADFALVADYQYETDALLNLPISVFLGKDDQQMQSREVRGWQEETSVPCEFTAFDGGHFFIDSESDAVLQHLRNVLNTHLNAAALSVGVVESDR